MVFQPPRKQSRDSHVGDLIVIFSRCQVTADAVFNWWLWPYLNVFRDVIKTSNLYYECSSSLCLHYKTGQFPPQHP